LFFKAYGNSKFIRICERLIIEKKSQVDKPKDLKISGLAGVFCVQLGLLIGFNWVFVYITYQSKCFVANEYITQKCRKIFF
jgi:hypothetical protein